MAAEPRSWARDLNGIGPITNGVLYPFVNDVRIYKCPTPFPRTEKGYDRTYSISGKLRGEQSQATRLSQVRRPGNTMAMIEDDDWRGYNENSWMLNLPNNWIDYVAGNHDEGDNLAFADGHTEYWRWQDPDTLALPYTESSFGMADPGSADLARLATVYWPQ